MSLLILLSFFSQIVSSLGGTSEFAIKYMYLMCIMQFNSFHWILLFLKRLIYHMVITRDMMVVMVNLVCLLSFMFCVFFFFTGTWLHDYMTHVNILGTSSVVKLIVSCCNLITHPHYMLCWRTILARISSLSASLVS